MIKPSYCYKARVIDVYDGDSITVSVDLGFKIWTELKIRLLDIDAPEVRGEERDLGLESRDFLTNLILDKDIILETEKDKKGKYGRYLGRIWLEMSGSDHDVNKLMVEYGQATPYE